MERIEPVGRWSPEPGRIERIRGPERTSRDQRGGQGRGEEPPRRRERSEEETGDDGEHIDVTV
jgi:hypothetical protein